MGAISRLFQVGEKISLFLDIVKQSNNPIGYSRVCYRLFSFGVVTQKYNCTT
jgi:hypothetical protein